jgi:tetratricopeptide (TPR) repeat protein
MKYSSILCLLLLISCSSGKVNQSTPSNASKDVTKDSFKKVKALSSSEVKDYISDRPKSMTPALSDETLDRYTKEEIAGLEKSTDPLISISIKCSQKEFDKAFEVASQAFNQYQKIPAYWNLVANCHLNQGSHRKALLFYNKALEVSPGYVPALNNIGVLYTRQGEDQKALLAFERANKQARFSKTPRYNLAKMYLRYGLIEPALPLFEGLLNESPADVDLLHAVGSCLFMQSDYQKASSYFSRLPAPILRQPEYGISVAMNLKKLGKTQDAQNLFRDIQEPKSGELKTYYSKVGNLLGVQ